MPVITSFTTKADVCEDETRQCDKCVFSELSCFWEQGKKSCKAILKRLVGIKLEGLEIE